MPNLVVEVEQGQLRGKADNDIKGREFFSFLGVPYAKPPVGSLRFKSPQPPDPWDGIREATEPGNFCYGTDLLLTAEGTALAKEGGSEDCLFLNIFTHELNRDVKVLKPVMLYIHGGGFTVGSSNPLLYGPHILMMEEIVLVTINYRTGALGFLSVDSEEIGNSGLKDMVQALKWVQRNIAVFGGDPSNVTIFGESAGGASVHYLVLSPLTKGLFHKAIAQSGNAINCWARGTKNNHILLAKALGCTESDDKAILSFLREQPVAKIFEGQRILKDPLDASVIRYFAPTVENSSPTAFLTEEPLQVIKSGKFNQVPFMTGYTDQEGLLMFIVDAIHMTLGLEDSVPYFLGFEKGSKEHSDVNKEIHQFFFGQDTLDHKNVPRKIDEEKHTNEATEQVVQPISVHIKTIGKSLPSGADISKLVTDNIVFREMNTSVKIHAVMSSAPVFYYRVTAVTDLNIAKKQGFPGVAHLDELMYLFKTIRTPDIVPNSVEDLTIQKFLRLWTNFAKTGNPTPENDHVLNIEWKPVTKNKLNFLEIGTELKTGTNPDAERIEFWDKIFSRAPKKYF